MADTEKKGLPYDMGNAGDLLKHGVLAEFVRWRLETDPARTMRFFDPFGGEPFDAAARAEVVRRVGALPGAALEAAQPEIAAGKYYGSGMAVRNLGGDRVSVYASDRCAERRERLRVAGLAMLEEAIPGCPVPPGYDAYGAVEHIGREAGPDDLTLIDPFGEFLEKAAPVVRQLGKMAERSAILLFALNLDPFNRVGRRFDKLLEEHLKGAWIMTCPPIRLTGVEGESTYHADVVLASPRLSGNRREVAEFRCRLECLSGQLADALALSEHDLKKMQPRIIGGAR